jgi:hypothetical protein
VLHVEEFGGSGKCVEDDEVEMRVGRCRFLWM